MSTATEQYTKESPFVTELLENYKLNKDGSQKDTRHFSICLKGSGIDYIPGDSLYVYPENEESLVNKLLDLLELDNEREEEFNRFTKEVNITRASNKLFKAIEAKTDGKLEAKALNERFTGFSLARIIEVLKSENTDLRVSSNELAENSSKLAARAYSIASSLSAHPEQVDLCIARVEEEINGQPVLGVCSNYLSDRIPLNQRSLRIYLHRNERFRLPENPSTAIIMVGPGTGIAPFRAFIEERNYLREQGQEVGQDWLFFGDQRAAYDFMYEDELKAAETQHGLRITTAFSRDQEEKVYVQNRMQEHADEIYQLLESGAHFYVCGDARRMAKDVDSTLQEIASNNGKDPTEYIKMLKDQGRYQRDVY